MPVVFVGHLGQEIRDKDLESLFGDFGKVREVNMKQNYAFVV